ncbi:MAG: acyl-CoA dehydrogenase family protein [Deltaproteobacteria bacterium]|nr:acyl-CoA dehydrogenase family protein [Deltaproteobacteria bacterium]
MQLVLTEDQELIAKTARDFVDEESPISRFRELRDSGDPVGFSKKLWKEMAELGWVGIPFPEAMGGAEMGFAELAIVIEALGRNLAPEPFLSSVAMAGQALLLGGSEEQQQAWIPGLVEGDKLLSLAYLEDGSRFDLNRVATRAEQKDGGWTIRGQKIQVLDGHVADAFVVSARTAGDDSDAEGIGLFLVPADAEGLTTSRQTRLDSVGAALVSFDGVEVAADAAIGEVESAGALLERVIDRATVALGAEMLGGMSKAFELTLEYLKERKQFGVPIGSFQALKHRAARVFIEIELSRSTVVAAARGIDEDREDLQKLVSVMKARCSDAYILTANEGIQMFGGVGTTDEYDIGFFLKRARAAELTFGDAAWHRDRWARLSGY